MPIALRFVIKYLYRQPFRVTVSALSISLAFGCLSLIYGLIGVLIDRSDKALALAVGDADIWVVPPHGVEIDPETGVLIPRGSLAVQDIEGLRKNDPSAQFESVLVNRQKTLFGTVVVYGLGARKNELSTVRVSSDIWQKLHNQPGQIIINGVTIDILNEDAALPLHTVTLPIELASRILDKPDEISWLRIKNPDLERWEKSNDLFLVVTTPLAVSDLNQNSPLLYPISNLGARFNLFSFGTQFSALVLNQAMSSLLGRTAQGILVLCIILSLTSTLIGLEEKREVIAVLALHGNIGEILFILLAETTVIHLCGFVLGAVGAIVILKNLTVMALGLNVGGNLLVMPLLYLPVSVLLCTLVASQRVLGRPSNRHLMDYA